MKNIPMRKPWKIIVGFALIGLAIAGACYALAVFHDLHQADEWTQFHSRDCFLDSLSATAALRLLCRL
jgi:hypothetical protein